MTETAAPPPITRGLVAVGDSITRGSGDAMLGLRMQSWALWLAEALGLPYTCLAVNGAKAPDAVRRQLPLLRGPYDLGCVYLGVNDVRALDWELEPYRASMEQVVAAVAGQCAMVLMVTVPQVLGRPPAPASAISAANGLIESLAQRHGASLLDLRSLGGSEFVQPDVVHLTARGEARVALLAGRAVVEGGAPWPLDDRELHEVLQPLSLRARLRYAGGPRAMAQGRDWRRRALEWRPG